MITAAQNIKQGGSFLTKRRSLLHKNKLPKVEYTEPVFELSPVKKAEALNRIRSGEDRSILAKEYGATARYMYDLARKNGLVKAQSRILTERSALEIRDLAATKFWLHREIAIWYGVSGSAVGAIHTRQAWANASWEK